MLQGQDDLEQAGHTGRGLQVADVGLHRADQERPSAGRFRRNGGQGLDLDRIAQPRASAVGLDVTRPAPAAGRRRPVRPGSPPPCAGPLGAVRPLLAAILVDGRTADHRQDPVAVAPRRDSRFSTTTPHPSAWPKPSAEASKVLHRPSGAIIRDWHIETTFPETGSGARRRPTPGRTHRPQRPAGQVQRHQRRGAGRVDRDGRTLQAQHVGQPPGGDSVRRARAEVRVESRRVAQLQLEIGIVAGRQANVNAGPAAAQPLGRQPGVLDASHATSSSSRCWGSIPCGFSRRDAEELRVEAVHVGQGIRPARRTSCRACPARDHK